MKVKALYTFNGYSEFSKFASIIETDNWRIENQLLLKRVIKYQKKPYFIELKKKFENSHITIWDLKAEEIITWLDTTIILKRFFVNLFETGISMEDLKIVMEYPLLFGNHTRTDFLIAYDRLIIVLEFGMFNQDEKRREERYTKKLQESMNYRRVLANLLAKEIEIVNYVIVYRPEYDPVRNINLDENIKYNKSEIEKFVIFAKHKIEQQMKLSAKSQLESLNMIK